MKTISMAIVLAILTWVGWLNVAHAQISDPMSEFMGHDPGHREVRNFWEMTCYPSNGVPYKVAFANGQLIITSARGVARRYEITDNWEAGPGFNVIAEGYGRQLQAAFSAKKGMLVAEGKYDYCSGDM